MSIEINNWPPLNDPEPWWKPTFGPTVVNSPRYTAGAKDTNPKDGIGATKLPLHLVPATAIALSSLAHLDGALKYGAWNWRAAGVRSSIYVDAAKRHIDKWFNGETLDPDSGVPHIAHALACLNILVDAEACGKLNDDRAPYLGLSEYMADLTPHVQRLKDKYADKCPKHHHFEGEPAEPGAGG